MFKVIRMTRSVFAPSFLLLFCLFVCSRSLFCLEADLYNVSDYGDRGFYLFILKVNGKNYAQTIACPELEAEENLLKALFDSPIPRSKPLSNSEYHSLLEEYEIPLKNVFNICPVDEKTNRAYLYRDEPGDITNTNYYIRFKNQRDSIFYKVKTTRVLHALGLKPESANYVAGNYFKGREIVVLDNGVEASNAIVDQEKQTIYIMVDIDKTVKADVIVKVRLKSKNGLTQNEQSIALPALKNQYIFNSNYYECSSDDLFFCEFQLPFKIYLEKMNYTLKDQMVIDEIEDVIFNNVVEIEPRKAASLFRESQKTKGLISKTTP